MFENKRKFALWVYPDTLEQVEAHYRADNCESRSEFIEKAVRFYIGYLNAEAPDGYLSTVVASTLRGIVAESDHRQNRMLFKLAVELAMLQNVVAASSEFDPQSLERLRGECVREVKRLNGGLSLEDACRWQREE